MQTQDIIADLKILGLPADATTPQVEQRYQQLVATFTCSTTDPPKLIELSSTTRDRLHKAYSRILPTQAEQPVRQQSIPRVLIGLLIGGIILICLFNFHPSSTPSNTDTGSTTDSNTGTATTTEPPVIQTPPNTDTGSTTSANTGTGTGTGTTTEPPVIQTPPVIQPPPIIQEPPQPPDQTPTIRTLNKLKAHMDAVADDMKQINREWANIAHDFQSAKEQMKPIQEQLNNQPRDVSGEGINLPPGHALSYRGTLLQRYGVLYKTYTDLSPQNQGYSNDYDRESQDYDNTLRQYNELAPQIGWNQLQANYPMPVGSKD